MSETQTPSEQSLGAFPTSDADPFEVAEEYAELFDDIDAGQYEAIKASISENGVETPIIIDADNKIIDGHHRVRAVRELRAAGESVPDIPFVQKPVRGDTLRARRANLARRDGHKQAGVEAYLVENLPPVPDGCDTDAEVMWPDDSNEWSLREAAERLGVGKGTVRSAIKDSGQVSRSGHLSIPTERERKRDAVREYLEQNPDATHTEVAEAVSVDVSRRTVSRWADEWFDDDDDADDSASTTDAAQASLLGAGDDADASSEIAQDAADGDETAQAALADEGTTTAEAATETRDEKEKEQQIQQDEQRRAEQRQAFCDAVAESDAVTVDHGDFQEVLADRPAESIDHIVTDPPYDEDALSLWENLAAEAARVLTPGGLLVAYSGQYYLPEVFKTLGDDLTYLWQFVVTHEQPNYFIKHDIGIKYKPVLVFGKEPVGRPERQMHDVIDTGSREKTDHDWQQPVIEAAELIDGLTEPNDTVCDPMCGSGTFGVAALRSGRQAVLIDTDEEAVRTTRERVSEVVSDE
jgi:site-specific DNA-methyltransferase (adenine-specific)